MSAQEVIVVSRRPRDKTAGLITVLTAVVQVAVRGWILMLLVPLAHRVFGTPNLRPGYLLCVLVAALLRSLLHDAAPQETVRRVRA